MKRLFWFQTSTSFRDTLPAARTRNPKSLIPLRNSENKVIGVLDVDSDVLDDFDQTDKEGLEEIVRVISRTIRS